MQEVCELVFTDEGKTILSLVEERLENADASSEPEE